MGIDKTLARKISSGELALVDIKDMSIETKGDSDSIEIKINIPNYIPRNVFKVFLKIGFGLIKENELSEFEIIRKLLLDEINNLHFEKLIITKFRIPEFKNIFEHPSFMLFKLKESKEDYCEKLLALYFGNLIYQVPIYSDKNYNHMRNLKPINYMKISPYLNPLILSDNGINEELSSDISEATNSSNDFSSILMTKEITESIKFQNR